MTLCLLEVLKQVILLTTHQFGKQYLPFDLCGISILFCLLEIWKPCAYFGELLYSLSLPGTLLALFFPNWNRLPLWNFFCIHSFLFHTLLLLLPVLLLADGTLQPNWKRLPLSFLTLAACSVVVAWLNRLWGTNFFFLSQPSKGSPLVWFADWFGASLYWISHFNCHHLGAVVCACWNFSASKTEKQELFVILNRSCFFIEKNKIRITLEGFVCDCF